MKFFRRRLRVVWVVLIAVLCTTPGSRLLAADDEGKSSTSTNHVSSKLEAPAPPLTERERELLDQQRWMLERMVELEKRVAELEAKQPKTDQDNATTSGKPSTVAAGTSAPESIRVPSPAASAEATSLSPASWSGRAVDPNARQATDKNKAAATTTEPSQPFAFADFTWMMPPV